MLLWKTKKSLNNKNVTQKVQNSRSVDSKQLKSETSSRETRPTPKKENTVKEQKSFHTRSDFLSVFNKFRGKHRPWDIWSDFIILFATSISNSVDKRYFDERESLYMKTIKKYNKREQLLFPELVALTVLALDENPEQDFLGSIFMELGLGNSAGGQFFTPYSVCKLMASATIENIWDVLTKKGREGYVTIHDPTCGAGATLIAGINEVKHQLEKSNLNFQNHILVSGQDIDYITGLMCYIQISLLGVAGYIKIGNTLSEPMSPNDSLENYWFTPMYFSNTWVLRRALENLGGKK